MERDVRRIGAIQDLAALVYGGSQRQHRTAGEAVPLTHFAEYLTTLDTPSPALTPGDLDT